MMNEKNHDVLYLLQDVEVITLLDEEGNPHLFYIIDVFESEGNRYAALQSIEEVDDMDEEDYDEEEYDEELFEGETILLRLEKTNDGDVLVGIEDDDEFERVASIFESRLADED